MATVARAAVFFGPGKPFEMREVPIPEVEPEGVLIRVTRANICGSDLHFWRGDAPLRLPDDGWIFGHEMTGTVARLGRPGEDRLAGSPAQGRRSRGLHLLLPLRPLPRLPAQGARRLPQQDRAAARAVGVPHLHGAFADHYYLRPGGVLFKVPDTLTDDVVAPVNCALAQVLYGLWVAGVRMGDRVLIQGAGGLGVQAAAVAKDMGAASVIVVDQIPGRLELARAFGADHTLNLKEMPERRDRVKQVRQWTEGVGVDVACDFVGFPAVIPEGIEMLRYGGTYLEIGTISRGAKIELEPSLLVWGSKKIVGVIQYDPWVIPRALSFLTRTQSRFPWDRIVSHKFPLEGINEAFAASEWHGKETHSITRAALTP